MVTMSTNECQNIASAIVINFEECNITLLQTKILKQNHVDQQTILGRLNEIRTQSRSKRLLFLRIYDTCSNVNSYICKKTYQFTTVCKDDVMISVL